VWIDINPGRLSRPPGLWRFQGPTAKITIRDAQTPGGPGQCGDLGEGSATVLGTTSGLYCVNSGTTHQSVNWLGPSGGRSTIVASVRIPSPYVYMSAAVIDRGAYYFIDPPTTVSEDTYDVNPPELHYSSMLYRVSPR
jgi:hypothetical protein